MTVDGKGRFKHAHDGVTDANRVINYVSWDDTKWSATRAGTGFFTVFVAGKDEQTSDAKVKDAVDWLEANKQSPGRRACWRASWARARASDAGAV